MLRRLLVVDDSAAMRSMIESFALAELDDITVDQAYSPEEAVEKAKQNPYEIVFCGASFEESNGVDLFAVLKASSLNQETPVIIISPGDHHRGNYLEKGVESFLTIPFSPQDLAELINRTNHPRLWREHLRLYVPETQAVLHLEKTDLFTRVINISLDGFLCEIDTARSPEFQRLSQPIRNGFEKADRYDFAKLRDLLDGTSVTLRFQGEHKELKISLLESRLIRFLVLGHDKLPGNRQYLRLAWRFVNAPPQQVEHLSNVLEEAKKVINEQVRQAHGDDQHAVVYL